MKTNKRTLQILMIGSLFLSLTSNAQNYTVNTIGGDGTIGSSGNNGLATLAELNSPTNVVADDSGNVFLVDNGNYEIRKISKAGTITTVAGTGTIGFSGDGGAATSAQINNVQGIALDATGNIYITDGFNCRIRKIATTGIITTIAGNGTFGFSGDGSAAISAEVNNPVGIGLDKAGNIYFCDAGNNRIRKISTSGTITTIAGNGTSGFSGDGNAATSAEIDGASQVAVDAAGNVYIADFSNRRIRKVSTSGTITTFAGNGVQGCTGNGGAATSCELNGPVGISIDTNGNLYIVDSQSDVVREVNTSGIINTIAGTAGAAGFSGDGGAATAALFSNSHGCFVNTTGDIYIADENNQRIRVLTKNPTGIDEITNSSLISVYPNPNSGKFKISQESNTNLTLLIFNILGEKIYSTYVTETKKEVNLGTITPGVYLFELNDDAQRTIKSGKLIIQ